MASWRRAVALDESVGVSQGEALYDLAGCHARLGRIANEQGSGLPVALGAAELDRAMELLGRAVHAGYCNVARMRRDPDLNPLRSRSDFQLLISDLAMPADPFSR